MFNADLRKADKKCGHQIVLALLLPCKICKKKKMFHENNFESNGQNFFVEAVFFFVVLFSFLPVLWE